MKASATIYFISSLSAKQVRYKAYRPESPQERESRPKDYSIIDSCCRIEGAWLVPGSSFLRASSLSIFLGCMPKAMFFVDWDGLIFAIVPLPCTIDAAAVPNMSLLLPQTASRFPSIDYRGFNHWTCLCSPLIECYFYKKDWVGKTWIGQFRDWPPQLLRHMRKRSNIFSIEIPIKDKFYQGQDLKEKNHFPEFQVTFFLQKLKLNDRSLLQVQSKRSKRSHQFNHANGLP